jgi:riboflavin synthase
MFTGIIKNIGQIKEFKKDKKGYYLSLISSLNFSKKDIGTSISCSGACLTLVKFKKNKKKSELFFYLSRHTYLTTAFQYWSVGDLINLEKSMKYGDEFAGHFVQGHVDTKVKVISIDSKNPNSWIIFLEIPKKFKRFLIEKGSVAINGISLTIAQIFSSRFKVVIIPHTLKCTNLLKLKKGDYVNVEIDLIAKTLLKK